MDDCCRKIPESGKSCRRLVPEPVRSPWSRCREPFSAAHDIAGAKRSPSSWAHCRKAGARREGCPRHVATAKVVAPHHTRHKETMMTKQVVAVLGGMGQQGGGVVDALLGAGKFAVRVASRNPASDAARALAVRGVEVVQADLLDPSSLRSALAGAHGAFVVTNFWDPAQMPRETEIGRAAVQAARAAGVKHLIWSTLPDCEKLTGGRLKVAHFPGKARVDAAVKPDGFERHPFVMPPP